MRRNDETSLSQIFAQRVGQCVLVIFVGDHDYIYYSRRLVPTNPVEVAIARVSAAGQHTAPEAVEEVRRALIELYGLEGSIWQQYLSFWGRLLKADLGPSYSSFPTPVIELIKVAPPRTAGLLLTSAVIAWVIGNFYRWNAGYFNTRRWARGVSVFAMAIRPIPYYIMAFVLLILFAYLIPCLPLSGALGIGIHPSFTLRFLTSMLKHAFLPALSLVIVGAGGWMLGMESLVSNIAAEDYVVYAKTAGVSDSKLLSRYVMRNAYCLR